MGVRFVDTDVLLYAISGDPEEQGKATRANELLSQRDVGLSVQVLQEFYVQTTRESRTDRLTHEQAATLVDSFRRFPVQETTVGVMLAAISTRQRLGISYWDAAILEAARALDCKVVLSEDLSDGEDYAGCESKTPSVATDWFECAGATIGLVLPCENRYAREEKTAAGSGNPSPSPAEDSAARSPDGPGMPLRTGERDTTRSVGGGGVCRREACSRSARRAARQSASTSPAKATQRAAKMAGSSIVP